MKGMNNMLVIKKKQIVTTLMVMLLITAGYINFICIDNKAGGDIAVLKQENIESEPEVYGEAKFVNVTENTDYFSETDFNKEKARAEELDILNQVANNENSTPEAKQKAQECIINIAKNVEKESNIENILMGKGYTSVSAFINDDGVTVAVGINQLTEGDIIKITDAAQSATGFENDKIKVLHIKKGM